MSLSMADYNRLVDIHRCTERNFEQLNSLNEKMDKQIALLEKMVEILTQINERRTDADY